MFGDSGFSEMKELILSQSHRRIVPSQPALAKVFPSCKNISLLIPLLINPSEFPVCID